MAENQTTRPLDLVLIGGGEHARVVLDATRSDRQWSVTGFVDPRPSKSLEGLGLTWLGDDKTAGESLRGRHCILAVGGVGDTTRRRAIARRYEHLGVSWAIVLHARAVISPTALVGPGATVLAGAVINPGARVGAHCIVNTGAIVEHDVDLGAFADVGPGAVVGGGASIGIGAYVGLGARVRDHIVIGAGAVVGMGAVVLDDVPAGAVVAGVPARRIRTAAEPLQASIPSAADADG
jgi:acetyltransferase EpsM